MDWPLWDDYQIPYFVIYASTVLIDCFNFDGKNQRSLIYRTYAADDGIQQHYAPNSIMINHYICSRIMQVKVIKSLQIYNL